MQLERKKQMRRLSLGVTAFLLFGSMQVMADQSTNPISESEVFTADRLAQVTGKDNMPKEGSEYSPKVVAAGLLGYTHDKNSIKTINIDMAGHNLTLDLTKVADLGTDFSAYGIRSNNKTTILIDSNKTNPGKNGTITIKAKTLWSPAGDSGSKYTSAHGIAVGNHGQRFNKKVKDDLVKTTINADVMIEELRGGSTRTTGISSLDCSDLSINGKFTIKPGAISLMQWNRGEQSKTYGIYMIGSNNTVSITTADIDDSKNGSLSDLIRTEESLWGGKTEKNILRIGGGTLKVKENQKDKNLLNASKGFQAFINVNQDGSAIGTSKADLQGTIRMNEGAEAYVGLTGGSKWVGGTQADTKGKMNLFLSEGGEWNTLNAGQGSRVTRLTGDAKGGSIYQKDAGQLVIENYSGAGKLFYEHENAGTKAEDYKAGDTHIGSAADGAKITVITDNKGITMTDNAQVYQVLNALAGKLYYDAYKNGEVKLTGKAVVAEGLTSTSKELQFKDMLFKKENGQGYVEDNSAPSAVLSPITGDKKKDLYYIEKKIRQADGTYLFKEDTELRMTDGQPMIISKKPVVIKAEGKKLTFASIADTDGTVSTVKQNSKNKINITAKELVVKAENKGGRSEGISLNSIDKSVTDITGDVTIQSKGKGYALGAYVAGKAKLDIHGNLTIKGDGDTWGIENAAPQSRGESAHYSTSGLYAGSNYNIQKGGQITVDGDVDLKVKGTGIVANGGGSTVTVKGGGQVDIEENDNDVHYALVAEGGIIHFNYDDDTGESGTKKVMIKGNVGVINGAANPNEPQRQSQIFLGLGTKDSTWKGLAVDNHTKTQNEDGYEGQLSLYMKNGATWTNEAYGATPAKFKGSKVYYLQGGTSKEQAGVIVQKDKNPLYIDTYAGNMKLIYAHENMGTKPEDYKAGDTHINSAVEQSWITMVTDGANIDTNNENQVYQVLNTLAGKLYYKEYINNEKNLNGEVTIAEGLTASSKTMKMKDLSFKKENGQGYVESKPTPPASLDVSEQIVDNGIGAENLYWRNNGYEIGEDEHQYVLKSDTTIHVNVSGPKTLHYGGNQGRHTANITWGDPTYVGDGYIDMSGHKLTLISEANHHTHSASGILSHGGDLEIKNVAGIDIDIHGDKNSQSGIYVWGQGQKRATLTIDNDDKEEHAVKIRNTAAEKDSAILVDGKSVQPGGGAKLVIKGLVDVENDDVSVIQANKGEAYIGGGKIIAKGNKASSLKVNNDGKLVINGELSDQNVLTAGAVKHNVQIEGNVLSEKGKLGLVLNTAKSYVKGLIGTDTITSGNTYMILSGGASWHNEGKGARTDSIGESRIKNLEADGGYIFQKHAKPITIENYKGNVKLFYEHENAGTKAEDYKAGDTHIGSAADGAKITVITDNKGITTTDNDQVYQVLNTLAGKLYYDAYKTGEKKLTGQVTIAEGLTSSSKSLNIEDISFKEANGQGYVKQKETPGGEDPKPPTLDNPVRKQIVEANHYAEQTREFWKKAGVYDGKGHYKFTKDLELVANAEDDTVGTINDNKFGAIYWNGDVDGEIDMTGHKLELKAATKTLPKQNPNTITVYSGTLRIKNTNGIYIESDPTGSLYGRGILVAGIKSDDKWNSGKGNSKLIIENDDDPAHAVKIRVKNTGEDFGAIEAQKHNGSALVDIKGLVDIDSQMWRAIESHGAKITIGGGTIKGTDVASLAAYTGGSILINAKLNDQNKVEATSSTRPVKITGDISAESGGHVMLGLNNKESFLKGLASTDINGINPDTQKWGPIHGKVSMVLANGATWEHKQVGVGYYHKKGGDINYKNRGKGESIDSHVTNLRADKGILLQNDPHKLTIDKYEGNMTLIYSHENAGTKAEDYKNGDVHIKEAAANSYITMVTDNSGIKMDDEKQVSEALNALAGKLYYEAFTKGEKNLKGQATIAEGLTASSRTLKMADIEYMDKNGQGYVKGINPNPNPDPDKPKPPIHEGDNETAMMRGGKSARMADILLWTSDTNDLQRRMGELRLAKGETGLWAKYQGGKNKLNEQKAYISQDYNMAQVGYDKQVGDWTVGGAIHYGTANNKYIRGDGKSKIASLALYGTKQGQDGSYIDLILKGSRLNNDYTLTEEQLGRTMSGSYNTNGISFSAEYGKRMKKENGFYIEPSIELTAGRLEGKDYAATSTFSGNQKMYIHHGAYNSLIGRIGISAGQETERSNLFAKIALAKEFSGKSDSDFRAEGEKERHEANIDLKDSWIDVEIGGSTTLGEDTYLYGTYTMNFGGKVENKWRVDAGIRYRF